MPDNPKLSPSTWDSKVVLGALVIIAYYVVVFAVLFAPKDIPAERIALVREMFAVLGPLIGIVAHAIWRNSKADSIRAEAEAEAVRSNAVAVENRSITRADPWENEL